MIYFGHLGIVGVLQTLVKVSIRCYRSRYKGITYVFICLLIIWLYEILVGDVFRCVYMFLLCFIYSTSPIVVSRAIICCHMIIYVCVKMAKNVFFNGFKGDILKQPLGLIYSEYVDLNEVIRSGLFDPMVICYAYINCLLDRYP